MYVHVFLVPCRVSSTVQRYRACIIMNHLSAGCQIGDALAFLVARTVAVHTELEELDLASAMSAD